jgi:hypothetical protein
MRIFPLASLPISLGLAACLAPPLGASPATAARATVPAAPNAENWALALPVPGVAREQAFKYLRERTGSGIAMPQFPRARALGWFFARHADPPRASAARYRLLWEDLLAAGQLLNDAHGPNRRAGLRLSLYAALWAGQQERDPWLRARIFEGFLLPNLDLCSPNATHEMSRHALLERAAGAYAEAREDGPQRVVLQKLAEAAPSANGRDWARLKLAALDAAQHHYTEAIVWLRAVESPEMNGARDWIAALQAQQAKAETDKQPAPAAEAPAVPLEEEKEVKAEEHE